MKIDVTLEEHDVRLTVTAQSLTYESNSWMQQTPEARERLKTALQYVLTRWIHDCGPQQTAGLSVDGMIRSELSAASETALLAPDPLSPEREARIRKNLTPPDFGVAPV